VSEGRGMEFDMRCMRERVREKREKREREIH
jgi:hypothetical protein